jgi:hypothetical protein
MTKKQIKIIREEIDYIYRVKLNLTVSKDIMETIKRLVELELLLEAECNQ